MATHGELINGICKQLLFSPKGGIEGALVQIRRVTVQLNIDPVAGTLLAHASPPGARLRVLATPDHSSKARQADHLVYRFTAFANAKGTAIDHDDASDTTIKGEVTALHYAKHGEANGVILAGGEFIHLRPHGMTLTGVEVGSKIRASGTLRMTVLGTRMLEASHVNGLALH